ncbi:hypothetical protein EI555_000522 [Monodon monoceros]|uniref:mitogen-activated protein kinase kinase n=1 Tax=Monodon monoceros TaxID=40151 RepID=A0A4U1EUZ3_MONMO|nr:hypothetical protein EI555_000522 [Monodon monoceros]
MAAPSPSGGGGSGGGSGSGTPGPVGSPAPGHPAVSSMQGKEGGGAETPAPGRGRWSRRGLSPRPRTPPDPAEEATEPPAPGGVVVVVPAPRPSALRPSAPRPGPAPRRRRKPQHGLELLQHGKDAMGRAQALQAALCSHVDPVTADTSTMHSALPLAAKRIRSTVDEKEQKQLLMDLDVVMRSSDCPYIVQFYGALFREGDCWICMELMSTSFDKFYKYVYSVLDDVIPEEILGKITLATVKALNHLKENLKIIHRDIKPSNILLDRSGNIKLCDFGISGQLVDSIAKTRDAGCRPYMAPERIDPSASRQGYDVRSDVWSLGITLYELATGRFPYPKWNSVFDQLTQVVKGDPPQLSNSEEREFSPSFINFVNLCLTKDESKRPKYKELLKHPFILMYEERAVEVACYVCKILDQMPATPSSPMYVD